MNLPLPSQVRDNPGVSRLELLSLSASHFLADGLQAMLLALLPFLVLSLGVSMAWVGMIAAAHFGLVVVLAIPIGRRLQAGDHDGPLWWVVILTAACAVACGLPGLRWGWPVWFLLGSVLLAAYHPIGFALVAHRSPQSKLASSMGWFVASGELGKACLVSLFVAGALVVTESLTVAVVAAGALLLGSWGLLRSRDTRQVKVHSADCNETITTRPAESRVAVSQIWRGRREFRQLVQIGTLDGLAHAALFVFLPLIAAAKDHGPLASGILLGAYFWASLLGKIFNGWVADRWERRTQIAVCQLVSAAALLLCCFVQAFALLLPLVLLLGISSKGTMPLVMASTAERLTTVERSVGLAVQQTLMGLAAACSPLLLGAAVQCLGLGWALVVPATLSLLNGCLATGLGHLPGETRCLAEAEAA